MPQVDLWNIAIGLVLGVPFSVLVYTPAQRWWDRHSERRKAKRDAAAVAQGNEIIVLGSNTRLLIAWLARRIIVALIMMNLVALLAWGGLPALGEPRSTVGELFSKMPANVVMFLLASFTGSIPAMHLVNTYRRVKHLHQQLDIIARKEREGHVSSLRAHGSGTDTAELPA